MSDEVSSESLPRDGVSHVGRAREDGRAQRDLVDRPVSRTRARRHSDLQTGDDHKFMAILQNICTKRI